MTIDPATAEILLSTREILTRYPHLRPHHLEYVAQNRIAIPDKDLSGNRQWSPSAVEKLITFYQELCQ